MPEGIEVCLTALWLNNILKNNILLNIKITGGRYSRHPLYGIDIFKKNKPYNINYVNSKGKFMYFILTSNITNAKYYILNRYGLEGEWGFTKYEHSGIEFEIQDHATNKINYLYFTDTRSFGTIEITNNTNDLIYELDRLAPDVLKTNFTNKDFYHYINQYITRNTENIISARANKEIVKVLMDQQAILSGIGNYIVSSVLFRSRISPYVKIIDIYNNKILLNRLGREIKYTVKLIYLTGNVGYLENLEPNMYRFITKLRNDIFNNPNHSLNFHPDIQLKKNDTYQFEVYRKKKDPYGNSVKADKIISGRTTYWSPKIQK